MPRSTEVIKESKGKSVSDNKSRNSDQSSSSDETETTDTNTESDSSSSEDSELEEEPVPLFYNYFKAFIAVITLIGGAIMALGINLFMISDLIHAVPKVVIIFPGDIKEVEKNGPISYCQFKNVGNDLCLNNKTIRNEFDRDALLLFECHHFFAPNQFFTFRNGTFQTSVEPRSRRKICAEVYDKLKVEMVACKPGRAQQRWEYLKNKSFYNYHSKKCMAARGRIPRDVVSVRPCVKGDRHQMWDCKKVNKEKILQGRAYLHHKPIYNESDTGQFTNISGGPPPTYEEEEDDDSSVIK